mmetsp:Transcript_46370/g.108340  ORF Transcript_46370/g.108340 Transcript_46370/m.108340 type:complete len:109 (-) Transcript_46370:101-427(-)
MDFIAQVLNSTSCHKVGVGLGQTVEALLSTFPDLQLEAWVDLAEHLWANSITMERLSLEEMSRWLLRRPRAERELKASEAAESRDLWPHVEGLVSLRQIQDQFSRGVS